MPDFGVRAAAQCLVEARACRGRVSAPQPARFVLVVSSIRAPLGTAHRPELAGGSAVSRTDRTQPLDSLIFRICFATPNHAEFGCYSLVPGTTLDSLTRGFAEAQAAGGDFCLATHYWEIDATLASVMQAFLDFAARQPRVRFVPVEQLFA